MTLNQTRGTLYTVARLLGHLQALLRGRIVRRFLRVRAGKATARGLGKVFKP